ncbi:sensor histidine kinase [Actinacidiphila alni]|uniref:sensor histidine kinase n=1 Tax=Actinacidiphila alni TaxID=380248 RepID=UPI001FEB8B76|nr:HAMP domain-containing sensor histidine kinase [Actinacidiphila alni]
MPWLRPTIRIRLTVLYGGMFLIAGVLLLWIIYMLAAQALHLGTDPLFTVTTGRVSIVSNKCPDLINATTSESFNSTLARCTATQREQALNELLKRSLLALIGLAVVAFAFGYVMAGRVLSPLGRITRTARAVVGSDLKRRIELDGPDDELKELADTFDGMLDRLERSFDAQRRFVANASHELRTPLAINRTLLEVQLSDPEASADLQQLGKTLLSTNERSEQLVEGLLLLARSENEIVDRKAVDLAEAASQALDQTRTEAQAKGVELRSRLDGAVVQGNGVLLERIALNLVQNAVRYNVAEDGWVDVATGVESGQAVLVVSNTGPVVPAYEVDNLFEPFRRLRTERTGSDKGVGLGLSIARSVARAHGGTIAAEPREGGGLVMRVAIPM